MTVYNNDELKAVLKRHGYTYPSLGSGEKLFAVQLLIIERLDKLIEK